MKGKAALGVAALVVAALAITSAALAYTLADYQAAVNALQAFDPTIAPPANDSKKDFVVGGFGDIYGYNNAISAQSNAGNTNPKGHHSATNPAGSASPQSGYKIRGDVICMAVSGNLAATGIQGTITDGTHQEVPYTEVEVYRDGGPGGALDGFNAFSVFNPEDCASFLGDAMFAPPITKGNILINDAP